MVGDEQSAVVASGQCSGEQAVYVPGEGIEIQDCNEDEIRNIHEVIEEKCEIKKPSYPERARGLTNDFYYFERAKNVFAEEEGDTEEVYRSSAESSSNTNNDQLSS